METVAVMLMRGCAFCRADIDQNSSFMHVVSIVQSTKKEDGTIEMRQDPPKPCFVCPACHTKLVAESLKAEKEQIKLAKLAKEEKEMGEEDVEVGEIGNG